MQVQLHPFLTRCGILPLGHGAGLHGEGLQHHFIFKPILNGSPLNLKYGAHLDIFQNGLGLPCLHELADPDGVGIVRHVELDDPGIALFQLLVIHLKHSALYNHRPHIQIQILHGDRVSPEGLSIERISGSRRCALGSLLFLCCRSGRQCADHLPTDGFHGIKESLSFQSLSGMNFHSHRDCKLFTQCFLHSRHQFLQFLFPVGLQSDVQGCSLPLPCGACQRPTGHGIPADKQLHQRIRVHLRQLIRREGSCQFQTAQAVHTGNVSGNSIQLPLRQKSICVNRYGYNPLLRVDIRSNNRRLCKRGRQLLRRLIIGKHI